MLFPAHIRIDEEGQSHVQSVEEHVRNCAQYAAMSAPSGMSSTAYLCGLLHDMGKLTHVFSEYLKEAVQGSARKGSVNHTFAGVRFVHERWGSAGQSFRSQTCELIAYVVGAHHGQFDCIAPDGSDGFAHRLITDLAEYRETKERFLPGIASAEELDRLFEEAVNEVSSASERLRPYADSTRELLFYFAMLTRQILSAVIEGDRRDTAEFMNGLSFSADQDNPVHFWRDRLSYLETRLSALPVRSEIDLARRSISEQCRTCADSGDGIVRLSVPTGGGKTLASLRFALAAAGLGRKRIFFVIPLLSVLEQNAAVIRDYIADDNMVLEHHSNVVREETSLTELHKNELLTESWRAPIVITTLVQLLDTLFSGRNSCVRRMSALNESIIVIDEVQTVPRNMLSVFNLAVNFIARMCGATVVLCSATQPCLEKTEHRLRYADSPELVPYDAAIWNVFRRTQIYDLRTDGGYENEELARLVIENADREGSLLLICNTKSEARELYKAVKAGWDGSIYHLSTAMCMEHRIKTLGEIITALHNKERVICVSTQLVEAGVDISFGCVIRILAGMDNTVQSAGRCNRSGEYGRLCPVYIVNLKGERLEHLTEIKQSQQASESLLVRFSRDKEAFMNDLTSEPAIAAYYRDLYAEMKKGSQDYPISARDYNTTLFELLSINTTSRNHCLSKVSYIIGQAFKTAGEQFHVFENNTTDVLVPYGSGADIIIELGSERALRDFTYRKELIAKAARFTVSLYEYEMIKLREAGGVYSLCDQTVLALHEYYYQADVGFIFSEDINTFLGV